MNIVANMGLPISCIEFSVRHIYVVAAMYRCPPTLCVLVAVGTQLSNMRTSEYCREVDERLPDNEYKKMHIVFYAPGLVERSQAIDQNTGHRPENKRLAENVAHSTSALLASKLHAEATNLRSSMPLEERTYRRCIGSTRCIIL